MTDPPSSNPRPPGQIVTRFAPSPTGYLHIGGARTALFNWAFARRHGGTFILRMEDTDVARSTPESTRRIIEDLRWLGLNWDEGPNPAAADAYDIASQRGAHGPYFQSQRGELYQQYLQRLIDAGRAYLDKGAYRFKMSGKDITVHDLVLGDVSIKAEQLEDFIIMKGEAASGGGSGVRGPTFHFANVVDDATMGVTHVLRAQEHLMNTPKHLALFEALGIAPPQYAHMPLIFNADGSKMSKRDKAKTAREAARKWLQANGNDTARLLTLTGLDAAQLTSFMGKETDANEIASSLSQALNVPLPEIDVHDFRANGYLNDVLLNYVALLGWSPEGKDEQGGERFDVDFLAHHFALEGIGKSNARFDRQKLLAFNGERLQKLPVDALRQQLRQHMEMKFPVFRDFFASRPGDFDTFVAAYQARMRTLDDPFVAGQFLITGDDQIQYDPKAVDKVLKKNEGAGLAMLRELQPALNALEPWNGPAIHKIIEDRAAATGKGMGDIAQPLRVAVSGSTVSPPIHDTLAILGRDATMARVRRCLELHGH